MKKITFFADDGPTEGFTVECGSWSIGSAGELRIYRDDAKPGLPIRLGFMGPAMMIPPKPPTLKAVLAPGKWSSVWEDSE